MLEPDEGGTPLSSGKARPLRTLSIPGKGKIVPRNSDPVAPLAARLDADGYLLLDDLFAPQPLTLARDELLRLFRTPAGRNHRQVSEIGTKQGSILELNRPSQKNEVLAKSSVFRAGLEVSQRILGGRVFSDFDHAILKPPHSDAPTAWHQDEAYHPNSSPDGTPLRRLHWWIPMQNTAAQNGGMVYMPGSHRQGLHPHQLVNSQDGTLRRVLEPATGNTIAATVRLGGAALHLPRTIHMAQPNASGEARLAWIIQVRGGSPTWDAVRYGCRNVVNGYKQWMQKRSVAA